MKHEQIVDRFFPNSASVTRFGNFHMCEITPDELLALCTTLFENGFQLKVITALDERKEWGAFRILYVFGLPKENLFLVPTLSVKEEFPSLASTFHQASIFERKIATFFGLIPKGHPDLRTLILHENWPEDVFPLRKDFAWDTRPAQAKGEFHFLRVDGEGMYEIPVGPVHAGIIEPGHFRFSVAGEEIVLLEPRLGYSHKGTEKLFETVSLDDAVLLSERISGDSSFSHSLAFCQAVESASGAEISEHAKFLRVIFCELERLANHFGDIGAIMLDTGFNFGGAQGTRLREIVMQINERLTGSRFLRGVNCFGGVTKDVDQKTVDSLILELDALKKDFSEVLSIAEDNASLIERLKDTGVLLTQIAKDHGVVGVPGKAVGFEIDARVDYPYAAYGKLKLSVATETTGDVHARFFVRVKEVFSSIDCVQQALKALPSGSVSVKEMPSLSKNTYAVGIVEGWRGDIVYVIATDEKGALRRVEVRDPSFLNWTALGHAGRGNMVPDFPLINKSFNLSYSGNDL